ncbi:TlpA family protein disulfide reductase [Aquimarina hainanensis]|uniref:TlpA family protein disulfide reductase n=1 Tax=Aquimarina hainanensis TaxID=1578017 RepID=A0ABW5NG77_9FLAO
MLTLKIRFYICILFSLILYSCGTEKEEIRESTYFGGEIVNPNSHYIILYREYGKGDTIYLDKNNRFLYKMDSLQEGAYLFYHSPENQIVLLEKGDSTLIRLNTLEFDESLVFTGDGAKKNNFLIDMFLQNEKERKNLNRYYFNFSPEDFRKKQQYLLKERLNKHDQFAAKNTLSDLAKKITKASFTYDFYSRYEIYFYKHYGITNLDSITDLPKDFFNYQKEVDFNDLVLSNLYSYNRFLSNYLTNAAYTKYTKGGLINRNSLGITKYEINLVDSLIDQPYIKDNLLRAITKRYILNSEDDIASNKVLKYFLSKSNNKNNQRELKKLAKAAYRLRPRSSIPEQDLLTHKGEIIPLTSLLKKPVTVFYFWSLQEHRDLYLKAHKKAAALEKQFPHTEFIGINIDEEYNSNWRRTIQRNQYDLNKEFAFRFPKCSSEDLIIYYRNQVILVDQDGKIINARSNLFSTQLKEELKQQGNL